MKEIIVAGSINMDVVARTRRHPQPGETVLGHALHFIPGGKGSNQAVAAGRLGGQVRLVGKLGQDAFGEELATFLNSESLNLEHLFRIADAPTGTALIVVNEDSENTIVVVPGSNAHLHTADINALPLNSNQVLVSQFEIPQETVRYLFKKGRAAGAMTVLNPAPAAEMLPGLLEEVDYLIVNETELALFSGRSTPTDDEAIIKSQAETLLQREGQAVIVTLGAKGALCFQGGDPLKIDGFQVKAVDTTGAGDCFVGALSVALAEGKPLSEALTFANAAAALSVQKLGASASLPTRRAVDDLLA